MANKWNEKEQGAKRRRSNQGTRGVTKPAASNPNKNTKSTDTNRNSGRTAAAKPAPKAAPKVAPKQTKPKTVYYSNKKNGSKGVTAGVKAAARAATSTATKKVDKKYPQIEGKRRLSRQKGAQAFVMGQSFAMGRVEFRRWIEECLRQGIDLTKLLGEPLYTDEEKQIHSLWTDAAEISDFVLME